MQKQGCSGGASGVLSLPVYQLAIIEFVEAVGVVEAEQTEKGEASRNDRLIAVAAESRDHRDVRSLDDLTDNVLEEIEHFFVSYNAIKGKEFKPLGRFGPDRAEKLVQEGMERHRKGRR